ncbi:uroporphyrinogen-III C-methyltransferase [Methanopyrus sp.]
MAGKLVLVGAGPGDPELLTFKAARAISRGDVILKDRLVPDEIIEEHASEDAEIIDVGKKPGGEGWTQEEINELIVREGTKGKTVVRVKSGDPLIFGRGAEEIEVALKHGMDVEVVPGVTSAIGVPTSLGLPLTHRKCASSFVVATGHEDPSKPENRVDFGALAEAADTLVVLMGARRLREIAREILGRRGNESVAILERGTTEQERVKVGTLEDAAEGRMKARPPAVVVVGEVVEWWKEILGRETR